MKACWCTLPSIDPDACKNCSNYENVNNTGNDYWPYPYEPTTVPQPIYPTKTIKRTTKTIEKYGPEGEYLGKEIITTDEEDIQVQDWSGTITITGITATDTPSTTSCTDWNPNEIIKLVTTSIKNVKNHYNI